MEEKTAKKESHNWLGSLTLIASSFLTTYSMGLDSMISDTIAAPSLWGVIFLIFCVISTLPLGMILNFSVLAPVIFFAEFLSDNNPNSKTKRRSPEEYFEEYYSLDYTLALAAFFSVISFLLKKPFILWLFSRIFE